MILSIRKIQEEDRDILLVWRNNPKVYQYALNPKQVMKEDHNLWFTKILTNPKCHFYLGLLNGNEKVGTVRYEELEKSEEVEVSISISPEFWGKGVGSILMALAEEELLLKTNVKRIFATVLCANSASLKMFIKSGFNEIAYDKIKEIKKFEKTIGK